CAPPFERHTDIVLSPPDHLTKMSSFKLVRNQVEGLRDRARTRYFKARARLGKIMNRAIDHRVVVEHDLASFPRLDARISSTLDHDTFTPILMDRLHALGIVDGSLPRSRAGR